MSVSTGLRHGQIRAGLGATEDAEPMSPLHKLEKLEKLHKPVEAELKIALSCHECMQRQKKSCCRCSSFSEKMACYRRAVAAFRLPLERYEALLRVGKRAEKITRGMATVGATMGIAYAVYKPPNPNSWIEPAAFRVGCFGVLGAAAGAVPLVLPYCYRALLIVAPGYGLGIAARQITAAFAMTAVTDTAITNTAPTANTATTQIQPSKV